MVKFNNVKFEKGNPKEGVNCYIDILLTSINMPTPGTGFTPKQNFERTELYKKLEKFKDQERVELEDADFKAIMLAYDVLQYTGRNDEAAEMYSYFQKIRK